MLTKGEAIRLGVVLAAILWVAGAILSAILCTILYPFSPELAQGFVFFPGMEEKSFILIFVSNLYAPIEIIFSWFS